MGQRRLPMEKMWPYEHDVRIPFWIRGPGIAPGTVLDVMGVNSDIAPTVLDLAGAAVPPIMDGRSLAPLLFGGDATAWRTRTICSFAEGQSQNWGPRPASIVWGDLTITRRRHGALRRQRVRRQGPRASARPRPGRGAVLLRQAGK